MPITSQCPQCQRQVRVPEDLLGRLVKCPSCGAQFTATAGGAPPPPPPTFEEPMPPPGPGPGAEQSWEDEERGGRRRAYAQAHRGSLILTLGIISIVAGALGLPTPCCLCFGMGSAVALGLGITAWLLGQADLVKMGQGVMDPAGRGQTQSGRTCGIIGTVLGGLGLVCGVGWTIISLVFHLGGSAMGGGFGR